MPNPTPGNNYGVEPSATVREAAHGIREIFVALTMEGFSEKQALVIVGQVLSAGFNAATGDDS